MALIDTYRHNVTRKRDEIAKLTSDKAKEETTPELYVRDSLKAENIVLVKP